MDIIYCVQEMKTHPTTPLAVHIINAGVEPRRRRREVAGWLIGFSAGWALALFAVYTFGGK